MTNKCVYVLECQGLFKIGKTTDLRYRAEQLQTASPFDFHLAHTIYSEDYAAIEMAMHRIFATRRVRGEWFALSQADIERIQSWTAEEVISQAAQVDLLSRKHNRAIGILAEETSFQPESMIQEPPKYIVPTAILEDAFQPEKPRRVLLSSFTRIFALAWESNYQYTPVINEQALMNFLKLSRRQYFEQKELMEKLGWLSSSHPSLGNVQFTFEQDLGVIED